MSRPCPDGPGQLAQHLEGMAHGLAPALSGEQREGDPQAPARHPHLVDRLLLARHRPGQLAEDALHPVLEQAGRPVVRVLSCHSPVSRGA